MNIKIYTDKIKRITGLSLQIAKAEFKLRNEGSYLGILWYLLNPILMFGLLFLVFNDRMGGGISDYPLYLLVGIIMFNFFQSTTGEATKSIIEVHRGVIRSINFPKESLILALVIKNLFSHFFEVLLLLLLIILLKGSILGIIFYPFILVFFCLFVFGVSAVLSSLTVYFVDMQNIWTFVVRLIWLATPIFYAIDGQTKLFYLNLLNPMYYFITLARDIIIHLNIDGNVVWGAFLYSLLFFLAGIIIFGRLKSNFAEKI